MPAQRDNNWYFNERDDIWITIAVDGRMTSDSQSSMKVYHRRVVEMVCCFNELANSVKGYRFGVRQRVKK
jgi:hypothetical protein